MLAGENKMRLLKKIALLTILGLVVLLVGATGVVLADGTETLGPPSIPIASGTGIAANGVGLEDTQPGIITLTVPSGVTVTQVLLYWSGGGLSINEAEDDTVQVNGINVTGIQIGGPTYFFQRGGVRYYFTTYRADITNLGVVSPGTTNNISVGGVDFGADENNGAGILAIYDDGATPAIIDLRDGTDVAFINFPGTRGSTVAQTFTFAPAPITRTVKIPMFFGSIARNGDVADRPSSISLTIGSEVYLFSDRLNSKDGPEWDTLILPEVDDDLQKVRIPPGVTTMTLQAFSRDDFNTDRLPASFTWMGGAVVITPEEQQQEFAAIGNRIWRDEGNGSPNDPNFNNGLLDAGETGLAGVALQLLNGDGSPYDADSGTAGVQPYIVNSDANGYYVFTNLPEGAYRVQVLGSNFTGVLNGFVSSNDRATTANPDNDVDNDDNGPGTASAAVTSGVVTIQFGTEPVGEPHLGGIDNDPNTNFTVDFGFWQAEPDIDLKKFTNGEDADTPTGPEVGYGDVVTWTYDITNTGKVTLTGVTLVDNIEGGISCPQSQLLPGETMTCVLTGVATTLGQYANTAVVTGTPTIFPTRVVTDDDPSHYLTRPFSLGNRIWRDDGSGGGVANDGLENGGEPGIGGVVVNLLTSNGTPVLGPNNQPLTTTTAADGCYLFDNLRRGDYIVEIAAGNFAAGASLTGFTSSTGNSSGGLAPSPNTDIDLDDNGNDTPVNGAIRSGVVTLSLNLEPLGEATCGAGSGSALDRNSNLTVDFGFVPLVPVTIGDFVWLDNNSNGLQDNGEPGVAGVTVRAFTAGGQPAVDINGAPVTAQVTDANGLYEFTNLPPGSYYVVFDLTTLPGGLVVTTPNVGNDDTIDSDASPSTGQTAATPFLAGGSSDLTLDMGLIELAAVRVGDYVWVDGNFNGQQDPGEPGVEGVTVTLFDAANDQQVAVDQTDASGLYLFNNLPPGQYYVVFDLTTIPEFYQVTTPNAAGVDDALDSDADPVTGRTPNSRVLNNGEEDLTLDMGIFVSLGLGNLVWLDGAEGDEEEPTFNNGFVDPGEPGVPGITVRLYAIDPITTLLATTTTDINGNYIFTRLVPGEYVVEIQLPDTMTNTFSSTGGEPGDPNPPFEPAPDPDNDVDDDDNGTATANPRIIRALPVTLSVGDEPDPNDPNYNPTVDFGLCENCSDGGQVLLAAIGDLVWFDENCDGIQEAVPVPVPNVTVRLYTANNELKETTTTDAQGRYLFDNLEPGQYFVEFVKPVDPQFNRFAPVKQGTDLAIDSDADLTTGRAETTQLVEGETDLTWDAGLCPALNIDPGEEPGQNRLFLPLVSE
jgi:uncharacterized repeat protein (TIGR01451 family)